MAITFVDDTAEAGQTDFLFNFLYLEDEHVAVFVDGVKKTIGASEDYTVQTSPTKKIVLNVAATGGEIVRVQRISAPAVDLVDFQNGSVLTEAELDRAYLHNRYLAEESAEQNDISLRVKAGADGSFDALNKKIVNVTDPTADQDAATKNYVDDTVAGVVGGSIPDGSITYAKIQNSVANNVILGNDNGADSDVQELTAAEVRTLLNVADGAEVNVQSNWSEADTNSDAFILNKPTIPTQTEPVPTGTVSAFAGSAAPTGYALCDGSAVNRTAQAALFSVIGTTYGIGDGSTTFNLPDLRGRVVAGLGESLLGATADSLGDDNGLIADTKEHTLLETELPAHDHLTLNNNAGNTGNPVDATNSASFSTSFGGASSYQMQAPTADPVANIGLSSETGGGLAHPNVQPTIILNYIIKT